MNFVRRPVLALLGLLASPVFAQVADHPKTQTLSYELRYATSESSAQNRERDRLTHVLKYSKLLGPRSKGSVFLLSSSLDARNPFGRSDATIRGAGVDFTYQTGAHTTATVAFAFADNAEVFNDGTGPAASNGAAQTLSFGLQRLIGYGPKSYLSAGLNHSITWLNQDFGTSTSRETRRKTTASVLYGYQIAERTALTLGIKGVVSSDRFSAHLVKQGGYANLGLAHRVGDTTVSLRGSTGIGALSGDRQLSLKISYDF